MPELRFSDFEAACRHARELGKSKQPHRLQRDGDGWLVTTPTAVKAPPVAEAPPVVTTPPVETAPPAPLSRKQQKRIEAFLSELRADLCSSTDPKALIALIKPHLPEVLVAASESRVQLSEDDLLLARSLPAYVEALTNFAAGLASLKYVKSKEYATELSFTFSEVAVTMSGFLIARRAEKEIRELTAKANTLPSEDAARGNAQLYGRIVTLEAEASKCVCGGRKKLYSGNGSYFWGCGNFPRCFKSRRSLNKQEADFLEDR